MAPLQSAFFFLEITNWPFLKRVSIFGQSKFWKLGSSGNSKIFRFASKSTSSSGLLRQSTNLSNDFFVWRENISKRRPAVVSSKSCHRHLLRLPDFFWFDRPLAYHRSSPPNSVSPPKGMQMCYYFGAPTSGVALGWFSVANFIAKHCSFHRFHIHHLRYFNCRFLFPCTITGWTHIVSLTLRREVVVRTYISLLQSKLLHPTFPHITSSDFR